HGLDIEALPAPEAAERIRARPGVAAALVTALDAWAAARSQENRPGAFALFAVAQAADPDPWRHKLREAIRKRGRDALEELAAEKDALRQPPATLWLLGTALVWPDASERGV